MLATLAAGPPPGTWWYERKLDGIRLVAARHGDDVALWSRNGLRRDASYPEVAAALAGQPYDRFVLDGEVVAFDGERTSFSLLQQRPSARGPGASTVEVFLYAFDLLHLDGVDLESHPLARRQALLADAFDFGGALRLSEHRDGDGGALLREACADGWEGLIAKDPASPYRAGRGRAWLKLKCVREQEVVIGGWTDPQGSRSGLGALLVGYYEGADLVFAGKVGTGFSEATLVRLAADLAPLARSTTPFAVDPPKGRDLHWVEPVLVCQVGFAEWTGGGKLRHARFLGLRDDKAAREVVRERPDGP